MATKVCCPTCSRSVEWTEGSRWRPFCSERCKLIDLGAWAAEQHAIPGEVAETEDDVKSGKHGDDET
jgi:endogenous inhibitor of DNA gyrase (YacG/DUF329 family)